MRHSKASSFLSNYQGYYQILNDNVRGGVLALIVLQFLVALMDGIGIALIIPLLSLTDKTSSEPPNQQFLETFVEIFGHINFGNMLILILVVFSIKGIFKFSTGILLARNFKQMLIDIRTILLNKFSLMNYQAFIDKGSGHFANIVNTQAKNAQSFLNLFIKFHTTLGNGVIYLILSFLLDWESSLWIVVLGGAAIFVLQQFSIIIERISKKRALEESNLNKFVLHLFNAYKYLKSTHRFDKPNEHALTSVSKLGQYDFKSRSIFAFTQAIYEPVIISIILGLIFVNVTVLHKPLEPILITLLLFYRTMNLMITAQGSWQSCMENSGSLKVIDEEMEYTNRNLEFDGEQLIDDFNHQIKFNQVSLTLQNNEVLKKIDLEINKNEFIGVVGPSGAGKTSLINMITGLYPTSSGEISVDDVSLSRAKKSTWRSKIGFISQEPVLFDDTIFNNISLWQNDALMEDVVASAKAAHCHEFISEMPDGYYSVIGENGVKLSGGQKQRVNIARELFKNPDLLIFDEATSALDSESEKFIQDSIQELKGKTTVIVIAHRLSTIVESDRIYVLKQGVVSEVGSFDELMKSQKSWLKKMAKIQGLQSVLS